MIRAFLTGLPQGFVRIFAPRHLVWHAVAIILTYLCVTSGFDWYYFTHTRFENLFELTIPAAILGFFLPIGVPIVMYYWGQWRGAAGLKLSPSCWPRPRRSAGSSRPYTRRLPAAYSPSSCPAQH